MSDGIITRLVLRKMLDIDVSNAEAIDLEQTLFSWLSSELENLKAELAEAKRLFDDCNEARSHAIREAVYNKDMWDGSVRRVTLLESELEAMNELSKKECREHALFAHATGERMNYLERQLAEASWLSKPVKRRRGKY